MSQLTHPSAALFVAAPRRPIRRIVASLLALALVALAVAARPTGRAVAAGEPAFATWGIENEAKTHWYDQATAVEHARSVDAITALRGSYRAHVPAMKAANPDLELLVYLNGAFAQGNEGSAFPADWYVYDQNGDKVKNNWGIYLMDPVVAGWRADRAQTCLDFLAESGYDGCFLDNLGPGAIWGPSLTGTPINRRTGKPWTITEWLDATTGLIDVVHGRVDVPVLVNGLGYGGAYFDTWNPTSRLLDHAGMAIAETWLRAPGSGVSTYRSESVWRQDIELLRDASARGKQVFAVTKVWTTATAAQVEAWHRFAVASFLLGDDGEHHFTFSGSRYDSTTDVDPLASVDLGAPLGAYRKVGGVYERSFERGVVLVNPTTASATHALASAHEDLDGRSVTSVTLAPHTGQILRQLEPAANEPPSVVIESPTDGSAVDTEVSMAGSALDTQDGDLSETIVWTSDRDGVVGRGARVVASLSTGKHRLTAAVQDSEGAVTEGSTSIEVMAPSGDGWSWTGSLAADSDSWFATPIEIPEGGVLTVTLDWPEASADLNLGLRDPAGTWVTWVHGASSRPERLSWPVTPGTWTLGVAAREGATTFSLDAELAAPDVSVSVTELSLVVHKSRRHVDGSVRVQSQDGAGIPGATVTLAMTQGDGGDKVIDVVTDASGRASFRSSATRGACVDVRVRTVAVSGWDGVQRVASVCL